MNKSEIYHVLKSIPKTLHFKLSNAILKPMIFRDIKRFLINSHIIFTHKKQFFKL